MAKGLLVTFEGGEGSGKTTLIQKLQQHLTRQGKEVVVTREPGGSPLGEAIRNLLLHHDAQVSIGPMAELLLFLAARAQHLQELIRPALVAGKIVLCDRFNDSTMAYQGAARNIDPLKVQTLCELICEGTEPVLTFLLDIDPKIGLERAKASRASMDRMEQEAMLFHTKVREGFRSLAKKWPERIVVIDASQSPEKVFELALQAIEVRL